MLSDACMVIFVLFELWMQGSLILLSFLGAKLRYFLLDNLFTVRFNSGLCLEIISADFYEFFTA